MSFMILEGIILSPKWKGRMKHKVSLQLNINDELFNLILIWIYAIPPQNIENWPKMKSWNEASNKVYIYFSPIFNISLFFRVIKLAKKLKSEMEME